MNRRGFLATSAASFITFPRPNTLALDERPVESPLIQLLDQIPDRAGGDGLTFPPTLAFNQPIRNQAPGEVPDMYWDPYSEDLNTVFGFSSIALLHTALQQSPDLFEFWQLDLEWMDVETTFNELMANGWELANHDLRLLRFTGSDDDRSELAASMNMVGDRIAGGSWDHIAMPDDNTIVLGADAALVRTTAERIKNRIALTPVRQNFHLLPSVLPVHTYEMNLLPPESLPIKGAVATFVCKSYETDTEIIHSVGVRVESPEQLEHLIQDIRQRFTSAVSPERQQPYIEFLELVDVVEEHSATRIDFIVTDGEWDAVRAADTGDLLMFPLADLVPEV